MPKSIKARFKLARIAAILFPAIDTSYRIASDTGMHTDRILMEQPAVLRWLAIVRECENDGLVGRLIEVMLADYPAHEELLKMRCEGG